jgi:CheY-like chemotaxis protein
VSARLRVLLVDDDESQFLVAERAIARAGLAAEVRGVGTGAEALAELGLAPGNARPPEPPAVVMLDLELPDMTGLDLLARIRASASLRTLPVVLVTSFDGPEDVRRAYEAGANSYLVKRPGDSPAGAYLAEAARYWLQLNVTPWAGGRETRHVG